MTYQFRKAAVASITAVAVATASSLAPVPAFADDDSLASLTRSMDSAPQQEYDKLIGTVKKEIEKATKSIDELTPKATKQKDDWGYDAAFEALNRLDEAQVTINNINRILDNLPASPDDHALDELKQARKMSFTLNQKISDAEYDVDLANKIHKGEKEDSFECKDAIDVGDTSGSSTGSSTTGIFNPLGNRIVYSKDGQPNCTTNLEYYSTKFTSTLTTLLTMASFLAGFNKVFQAFTQRGQQKPDANADKDAAAAPATAG
ncbi:hypothetical protein ACFSSC_04245 [Corynebacterium mendelii]|uniref:Secreted protein n=1 Tax=Corynebacterium mendelii TaxID=2765362 RepID=A0A939IT22_9CORY|nr:hypothetical protein [Corynebacterium mendelii]MBN9643384.1 hypothetical protein [Corynebacterium mendelii]